MVLHPQSPPSRIQKAGRPAPPPVRWPKRRRGCNAFHQSGDWMCQCVCSRLTQTTRSPSSQTSLSVLGVPKSVPQPCRQDRPVARKSVGSDPYNSLFLSVIAAPCRRFCCFRTPSLTFNSSTNRCVAVPSPNPTQSVVPPAPPPQTSSHPLHAPPPPACVAHHLNMQRSRHPAELSGFIRFVDNTDLPPRHCGECECHEAHARLSRWSARASQSIIGFIVENRFRG